MPSLASDGATAEPVSWRPTVAHVALLLPWIMAVVASRLPMGDNSFLWHVTAGMLQNDSGSVLTTDPFSFTFAGEPWRTQAWLADIGYDVLDGWVGLGFVTPMVAVSALVVFGMVMLASFRASGSVEATVVTGVLTAWLAAIFLNPRPVLFSYALFALVVAVSGRRSMRWTIPLIIWVWASMHGSFVLGLGYVFLDGLRRKEYRVAFGDALAGTVAATFTAHGLGVWMVLLEFAGSRESLSLITEWRTPNLTGVALLPFLIGIVLLLVGGMRGRIGLSDLWIIVPFLVFGLAATRSVFPAWIPMAPLVAASLGGIRRATPSSSKWPPPLVVTGALLLVVPLIAPIEGGLSDRFPVEAAEALDAERVFHDDVVGGYLIYRFDGERRVFVDDRAELFTGDFFRDVLGTRSGTPVWSEVFDRWGVEQALLRADDGLVQVLGDEGWVETHIDEDFVVLTAS